MFIGRFSLNKHTNEQRISVYFLDWGVEGVGVGGSAPLPLQRGRDPLKISPRQLIRERQAVAAEMFVVVRLLWLQQCTGGEGPGHVWGLWSIASLWNGAWLKHQRVFHVMIWLSRADRMWRLHMQELDLQTHVTGWGLTGLNWRPLWKRLTADKRPPGPASQRNLAHRGRSFRSNAVAKMFHDDPPIRCN